MQKYITLKKMITSLNSENKAIYYMDDNKLNHLVGKNIIIKFLNEINCIYCGNIINKSYSQGYCFMCTRKLPQCDICMFKPELCHFEKGTCRDHQWAKNYCMNNHIVYLANTGNLKVGITKLTNIPYRWIDQGASQAIPIFIVKTRLISGLVEIAIKEHISDKTNWRKMLQGVPNMDINLINLKNELIKKSEKTIEFIQKKFGINSILIADNYVQSIIFPVIKYSEKVKSFDLNKEPIINAKLIGIKGQYFIFDTGVINIRKFSGYKCKLEIK